MYHDYSEEHHNERRYSEYHDTVEEIKREKSFRAYFKIYIQKKRHSILTNQQ